MIIKTNSCIDIILLKRTDYKNENMNENKKKAKISKIIEPIYTFSHFI